MRQKSRIQYLNNMLVDAYHEIEQLKKESSHLAAYQCQFPYAGEGGDAECSEINRLRNVLKTIAEENYDDDDGKTELRNIIDELKRYAIENIKPPSKKII